VSAGAKRADAGHDEGFASVVRCVDALESAAESYVTLAEVRAACTLDSLQAALFDELLLVDERHRLDAASGELLPTTVCRLNRRHPLVRQLLAW
jgi:hypothetical protein